MPSEEADKVIGLFSINFQRNKIYYFGKRVNYNLNRIVIIRNKEVGYEIHQDGLPGYII